MDQAAPARFATPAARVTYDADGALLLQHGIALDGYDRQVGVWLRRWSERTPDRVMLAEWDAAGTLRTTRYAEARRQCDALSQGLLEPRAGAGSPYRDALGEERGTGAADPGCLAGRHSGLPDFAGLLAAR